MSIGIEIKDSVEPVIDSLLKRLRNPGDFWGRVGIKMERSVKTNFQEGGRPLKWKQSQRAIRDGGLTLVDSGRLRSSIKWKLGRDRQGVSIGTPVEYARKANKDRPFMVIQKQDMRGIIDLLHKFFEIKR